MLNADAIRRAAIPALPQRLWARPCRLLENHVQQRPRIARQRSFVHTPLRQASLRPCHTDDCPCLHAADCLSGYGDQRKCELLVEAGFSPEEAIRIMSLNGAALLKEDHLYGSVEPGKLADWSSSAAIPSHRPATSATLRWCSGTAWATTRTG